MEIWLYAIGSVMLVSLVSLFGLVLLPLTKDHKKMIIYMVSFSAGALFGDAFLHLLPEAAEEIGLTTNLALYLISGIVFSLVVEKIIRWRHCHHPTTQDHPHPIVFMNLIGDAAHNFIDGIIIAASYMASVPVGIATTIAVILHEIPQEIGDFGVLLHGGFDKKKAILFNFIIALIAIAGAVIALLLGQIAQGATVFIVPFAAGAFIYIAGSDLIPELHKDNDDWKESIIQIAWFVGGIFVMVLLLALE